MTNEEMERGIEFLLKHQADFEARQAQSETRQAQTEAQVIQTSQQVEVLATQVEVLAKQVEVLAKMHAEFTQFVRSNLEAQSEFNQSVRETVRVLTIAQARTDERLSYLEEQK
jgi:hypothetical protein